MKILVAAGAVAIVAIGWQAGDIAVAQQAPTYRYCLLERTGSTLCRFNTYEQCMASQTTHTDSCIINPYLVQQQRK
jgi:hypothetical protein